MEINSFIEELKQIQPNFQLYNQGAFIEFKDFLSKILLDQTPTPEIVQLFNKFNSRKVSYYKDLLNALIRSKETENFLSVITGLDITKNTKPRKQVRGSGRYLQYKSDEPEGKNNTLILVGSSQVVLWWD